MALRTRTTVSSSFAFCSKSVDSHQLMRSSNYRTMLLSHDTGFQSGKASGSPQIAVWGKKSAGFLSSFQLVDGPQTYLQHGASASSSESGRRVEEKTPAARSLGTGGDDDAANPAGTSLLVVSFYKFANLPDCEQMRAPLKEICEANVSSVSSILQVLNRRGLCYNCGFFLLDMWLWSSIVGFLSQVLTIFFLLHINTKKIRLNLEHKDQNFGCQDTKSKEELCNSFYLKMMQMLNLALPSVILTLNPKP
jgi:hypothetical protein